MQQEEEIQNLLTQGGIPMTYLISTGAEFLTCPICFNLLWQPIACGQDRCFSSFCQSCIENWLSTTMVSIDEFFGDDLLGENVLDTSENAIQLKLRGKCPKCKRQFIPTSIPIVGRLLEELVLKCVHDGNLKFNKIFYFFKDCNIQVKYSKFEQHIKECENRTQNCVGCGNKFKVSEIENHIAQCQDVQLECNLCKEYMPKKYLINHDKYSCIQNQLNNKEDEIISLKQKIQLQNLYLTDVDQVISKLENGDIERISEFKFSTIFNMNYQFHNNIALLVRNSYNFVKQKNDYLHFYLDRLFTNQIFSFEWRIKIVKLTGNLLIGISSTQQQNSIDYMVNRYGELKKKELNDNKYRQIRKVNFSFGEDDHILFQYMSISQCLRIKNENRHLLCHFEKQELQEMNGCFFNFFSLETQGDQIQFY